MAQRFPPSKPKVGNIRRFPRLDAFFQVEKGPVSSTKRDVRHLEEYRKRSHIQRGNNTFKTANQRSELTIGEQVIGKYSPRGEYEQDNPTLLAPGFTIQTFPSVDRECCVKKLMPRCFSYVQNYHHYIEDIQKLERGESVPYLTTVELKDSDVKTTNIHNNNGETCHASQSRPPRYFSGLPARQPKSSASSRRSSAGARRSTPNSLDGKRTVPASPETEKTSDEEIQTHNELIKDSLQHVIVSEIENELNEKLIVSNDQSLLDVTTLDLNFKPEAQPDIVPSSFTNNKPSPSPPSVTPVDSPRANNKSRNVSRAASASTRAASAGARSDFGGSMSEYDFRGVTQEIYKPCLDAFTTRMPPLKAPDPNLMDHKQKETFANTTPDYQRYRMLCDAFRPNTAHGGRRRGRGAHRPNFVTSMELDYYIDVVTSINQY